MKITNTPDHLIVDDTPWLFGVILMAALFGVVTSGLISLSNAEFGTALVHLGIVAFLMVFVWAFVRRNQLLLNAPARTVTHRRRTIFSHTEIVHNLSNLAGAIVEESHGDKGTTYRMTLQISAGMDRGDHPFTMAYTSGKGAKRATQAVTDWLSEYRR